MAEATDPHRTSPGPGEAAGLPESAAPLLALPWRAFPFQFEKGEFSVNGKPLFVSEIPEAEVRDASSQDDADTGRTTWDGSVVLALFLEAHQELVRGTRVLELGAGTGLVGLSAAALGAEEVVLTDLAYALPNMRRNVEKTLGSWKVNLERGDATPTPSDPSPSPPRVLVTELDWMEPEKSEVFGSQGGSEFCDVMEGSEAVIAIESFDEAKPSCTLSVEGKGTQTQTASPIPPSFQFDLVLASDVVWLSSLVEPLTGLLGKLFGGSNLKTTRGAHVVMSHQTRSAQTEMLFLNAMRERGFAMKEMELPPSASRSQNMHVWMFMKN
uniref:Methyltransferase small domain-containing protein n=1 Tax=Chromera velia CCMP2878 TaxID=1169474 RepID=A0A0G4GHW1_9ALVE|eukprot:Cvel_661.t1-p1 / transcript=Cvel_661.t1 / gene=Cvel_661 / organism=Chromera_velia_CCMP2878 / gene_product=hypothetical protein / transcript_product=hypothetical protein / location=Cvel_scaffold20:117293-118584(+) / protein_length=325 / sequence_SO=supercontig / SO=protein_coding / is_pseudo=false